MDIMSSILGGVFGIIVAILFIIEFTPNFLKGFWKNFLYFTLIYVLIIFIHIIAFAIIVGGLIDSYDFLITYSFVPLIGIIKGGLYLRKKKSKKNKN